MNKKVVEMSVQITVDLDGGCSLQGFPDDPVLAYGILKRAEKSLDEVFAHNREVERQSEGERIKKPQLVMVPAEAIEQNIPPLARP